MIVLGVYFQSIVEYTNVLESIIRVLRMMVVLKLSIIEVSSVDT